MSESINTGEPTVMPELQQILGALLFGAGRPLDVPEMRRCLVAVAGEEGQEKAAFGSVKESDIREALAQLATGLERSRCGFLLREVAGSYRFHSDSSCGDWLRRLLNADPPARLSRPALETLAIIAYRQPATRAQIEAVRGVAVDHVVRVLLEMQLVRIVGRSDLPGRPFLYGTTQGFLEHFGLRSVDDLREMAPSLAQEIVRLREKAEAGPEPGTPAAPQEDSDEETGQEPEPEAEEDPQGEDDDHVAG